MILGPGAIAPDFTLANQFGQPVSLADFRGVKPVTLVFFPLAFSRTCQGELCELRDHPELFEDSGTELLGVSVDSKHALRAWAEEQGYGFQLLADFWPHGEVARAYGAFNEALGCANRVAVVIDKDGKVVDRFDTPDLKTPRTRERYEEALKKL